MTTRRLLCLVTDRRRLAAIAGRPEADAVRLVLSQIEGAIRGGIDLVQIRERDLEAGALTRLVRDALRLAEGSPTCVVVNERVDVAITTGAGVHLREASAVPAIVRSQWPAMTIGRSVHSRESLVHASGADYLVAGTTFPSSAKAAGPYLGAEGLATIVNLAAGTPVLAIGGVGVPQLPVIVRAGARGIAAIGAFMPDQGEEHIAESVAERVKTIRFAFDSVSTVS